MANRLSCWSRPGYGMLPQQSGVPNATCRWTDWPKSWASPDRFASGPPGGKKAYRPATAADTQRLEEAAPTKPTAVPLQPRKVLIFQKTTWPAVMLVDDAFKIMGKKSGAFEVTTITDDASVMTPEWLRKFDMIVLNNTNELRLDDVQTQALQDFVRNGKGVIALGSAISSQFWAEQAEMLGGYRS